MYVCKWYLNIKVFMNILKGLDVLCNNKFIYLYL